MAVVQQDPAEEAADDEPAAVSRIFCEVRIVAVPGRTARATKPPTTPMRINPRTVSSTGVPLTADGHWAGDGGRQQRTDRRLPLVCVESQGLEGAPQFVRIRISSV